MRFDRLVRTGLAALLPAWYTPQASVSPFSLSSSNITAREERLARSYMGVKRLDLENVIAHGDESGVTYDITDKQTPVSASPNMHSLTKLLNRYGKLTISHNHPVSVDAYKQFLMQNGRQDLANKLDAVDKTLAARRLLYERPSGADIRFLLATQLQGYLARSDSQVTQQIVVTEPGKPFRIIEYDVDARIKQGLRRLADTIKDMYARGDKRALHEAVSRARSGIELLGQHYEAQVARYDAARARPWDPVGVAPEPSAREFRKYINSSGPVRIIDRGYLPSAQPKAEQYSIAA